MKNEKLNNNNMNNINICSEIELLIDEYLDGEISSENKNKMEKHLSECESCSKYREETEMLLEKVSTISKNAGQISTEKRNEIWNKIESSFSGSNGTGRIYTLNPGLSSSSKKGFTFGKFRYAISGIAAVLILGFIILAVKYFNQKTETGTGNISSNVIPAKFWKVSSVKGSPAIDNITMRNTDSVKMGQWITTDDSSKAELTVADIGTVMIEPKTKIKLVKSEDNDHRIALEYGTIAAEMSSIPRTFFVDTKSVTAVDLGCAYTFSIDSNGDGILYVKSGKVSLESPNRESVVPAGKVCLTRKDLGPGTPFREDSSPELKKALVDFDFGQCGGYCVNVILKNAKKTDAVTLLNILPRVDNDYKEKIYSKVSDYVPPPRHTPADSIPFINMDHLDEWIEKIQDQVQNKIEESMSKLEESMEKMNDMQFKFDTEKWNKEWEKNWEKNGKNWKFGWRNHRGDNDNDSSIFFKIHGDSLIMDKETMKRTMDEVKAELEKAKEEMNLDNEQFKIEMERAKEEIEKANEDMQKSQEEIEKSKEEKEKNKEEIKKHKHELKNLDKELKKLEKDKEKDKEKDNDDKDRGNDK